MPILPFLAMFFMVRKGFVYAVAVNFYAFCLVFCPILHCILPHFALHFAPFYLAFSTKTQCVLRHFISRFAPKRSAFSGILHCIWLQTAQNLVQIAVLCNVYSFHLHL